MFIVLKKKTLIILVAAVLAAALFTGMTLAVVSVQNNAKATAAVVVLDAGHGGIDAGATGVKSGVSEKEINLILAKKVKVLLEKAGVKVVMTRENGNGLYEENAKNKKRSDMAKRKEIINKAEPDVVVSIHGNKFPDKNRRGAQVFFESMSPSSKALATMIQSSLNLLNKEKINKQFEPLKGDYYILKCSSYTSAIVEYGFLSNADDDALLQDEQYRDKLAFSIYSGIMAYLTKNVTGITEETPEQTL